MLEHRVGRNRSDDRRGFEDGNAASQRLWFLSPAGITRSTRRTFLGRNPTKTGRRRRDRGNPAQAIPTLTCLLFRFLSLRLHPSHPKQLPSERITGWFYRELSNNERNRWGTAQRGRVRASHKLYAFLRRFLLLG